MSIVIKNLVVALLYFLSAKAVAPLSLVESGSVFAVWPNIFKNLKNMYVFFLYL